MEAGERTERFRLERETYAARDVLDRVYRALTEKGYNPVEQLVGYLLSGEPAATRLGRKTS